MPRSGYWPVVLHGAGDPQGTFQGAIADELATLGIKVLLGAACRPPTFLPAMAAKVLMPVVWPSGRVLSDPVRRRVRSGSQGAGAIADTPCNGLTKESRAGVISNAPMGQPGSSDRFAGEFRRVGYAWPWSTVVLAAAGVVLRLGFTLAVSSASEGKPSSFTRRGWWRASRRCTRSEPTANVDLATRNSRPCKAQYLQADAAGTPGQPRRPGPLAAPAVIFPAWSSATAGRSS